MIKEKLRKRNSLESAYLWQDYCKCGSYAGRATDLNLPAMLLDECTNQAETQARAGYGAAFVSTKEAVKEMWNLVRRYSYTCVTYGNNHFSITLFS